MQLEQLISASVGNNMDNRAEDVLCVKDALARKGLFDNISSPEPHGFITREMDAGIKRFQTDNDLKIDGLLYPNGETENALMGRKSVSQDMPVRYDATGRIIREDLITRLSAEEGEPKGESDPPIPSPKPESPPPGNGWGSDNNDNDNGGDSDDSDDGHSDDDQSDDDSDKDDEVCDDLFEALYDIHDQMSVVGEKQADVESRLTPKRQDLERLKNEFQKQYEKAIPFPGDAKGKLKGPAMALDVVTIGLNVKNLNALEKQIEALETEVSDLQKIYEDLDIQLQTFKKRRDDLSEQIRVLCPNREM